MAVLAYQQKGRDHIRYINRRAHNIWETYGYNNEMWLIALKRALREHIDYIEVAERINREEELRKNAKPHKCETYWRDGDKWAPLVP